MSLGMADIWDKENPAAIKGPTEVVGFSGI
jgi:hypothetical protein